MKDDADRLTRGKKSKRIPSRPNPSSIIWQFWHVQRQTAQVRHATM